MRRARCAFGAEHDRTDGRSADHVRLVQSRARPLRTLSVRQSGGEDASVGPCSADLVEAGRHLFYYGAQNPWAAHHSVDWRIYTGGKSPDKRVNMKVLWTAVPPVSDAPSLSVRGVRIGRPGSFVQVLAVGPSILKIPRPGCWRLTLKAGGTTSHLTVLAVRS